MNSIFSSRAAADPRMAEIVKAGKLRIGVFPSFQFSRDAAGKPRGLALDIANAMSGRLGIAEVIVVEHPAPPQVIACVKLGDCDMAFMLIDPTRAPEVHFTPAFVRSDFTYLVPLGSPLRNTADIDRPGVRVAAVREHASTIALFRLLKQAQLVYAETYCLCPLKLSHSCGASGRFWDGSEAVFGRGVLEDLAAG